MVSFLAPLDVGLAGKYGKAPVQEMEGRIKGGGSGTDQILRGERGEWWAVGGATTQEKVSVVGEWLGKRVSSSRREADDTDPPIVA